MTRENPMDDPRIDVEIIASAAAEATLRMRGDIDIAADAALAGAYAPTVRPGSSWTSGASATSTPPASR
jgi:glutamate/tyrosine decarboxylase-like PLP-dependent enzyme